ncbi:MAG: Gfo/Idh/MocA family oxidoreductase [Kiritimatiellia bacterium]|jgi:predicted dehydrogenase|nr:Gfo/Idh/MocA family oxidoreductase [Kiritimatiellia bacterium]
MNTTRPVARRAFLRLAHAGMAVLPAMTAARASGQSAAAQPGAYARQVKLGLVGCGGRGSWISNLFKANGGFALTAVADYFADRAARVGAQLGVPPSHCFSGLDGYRRLMASGVEAVVLQTPPYFFPAHAEAALDAGLHLYMAKPVAIDIPGTLTIRRLAARATQERRVFLADYQLPRDPVNQEVAKRIRAGALGRLQTVFSSGWAGGNGYQDPPLETPIANRLKDLVWCNDLALGGDYLVHYDVHILDAVVWALGKTPVAAMGASAALRPSVHGDARDSSTVVFLFDDGTAWCHQGMLGSYHDWLKAGRLTASLQGTQGAACLSYAGKAYVRGGPRHFSGGIPNPEASVKTNIHEFRQAIETSACDNAQVLRAVDSNLTAILGREAAARRERVTLEALIREARILQPDLSGLTR